MVVTFRLERYTPQGDRLPPVPVIMRGYSFDGALHDGDWVRVSAIPKTGGTIDVDAVQDLTTGAVVKARRKAPRWALAAYVLIAVLFVIFFSALAWSFLHQSSGPPPGFP